VQHEEKNRPNKGQSGGAGKAQKAIAKEEIQGAAA
jgi:hypothetical protein